MKKEVREVIERLYDLCIRHMKGSDASAERIELITMALDDARERVEDLEKRLAAERAIWTEHDRRRQRARALIERIEEDCYLTEGAQ